MISSCIKSVISLHTMSHVSCYGYIISHTFVRVVSKNLPLENILKWNGLVLNWCLPICNKLNIIWLLILEIQNFSSSVEKYFTEQILDVSSLMLPFDSILFHLWGTRQISMAAGLTKRATYLHTSADDNLFSIHSHQVKKDLPPSSLVLVDCIHKWWSINK